MKMEHDKKIKSFEENLQELEKIVKQLESGDIPLDDAINAYTEAMKLVRVCDERLKNAEEQINKILTENGKLEDFNIEEEK